MRPDRVRGHLRTLLLAAVAAHEPAHGYALISALSGASDGYFAFNEGAVYPSLHQLEADGLVTSTWDSDTGRRRRVYELTDAGRTQLEADAADWHRFKDSVESIFTEVTWLNH